MARDLKISSVAVGHWLRDKSQNGRTIPAKQCVRIEQIVGGIVTRRDLREDWAEIWPELADPKPNPPPAPVPPAQAAINCVVGEVAHG